MTFKKEPNFYLIKRSNSFRDLRKNNVKRKGFFEITIRNNVFLPPSAKIKPSDTVYVAETSGGIFAKGKVIESSKVLEFATVEEVLEFSNKFNDDQYWIHKIREFSKKLSTDSSYRLRFHEYFINQKVLKRTIPYKGPLEKYDASINWGMARIFFKLNDDDIEYLKNPDCNLRDITEIRSEIPGDLRLKVHSFFNKHTNVGHIIDIDHFVPKSVGGPGNIIENLVPVGFSLNRYKNDSIPKSLFEVASTMTYQEHFKEILKEIRKIAQIDQDYISTSKHPKAKDVAMKITGIVNQWIDLDEIKSFYFSVNERFNPSYSEMIREIKNA